MNFDSIIMNLNSVNSGKLSAANAKNLDQILRTLDSLRKNLDTFKAEALDNLE